MRKADGKTGVKGGAEVLANGDFKACVQWFQEGLARRVRCLEGFDDELPDFWQLSLRYFKTCLLVEAKTRDEMAELEKPIADRVRQLWGERPNFDWIWVHLRQFACDMYTCFRRRTYTDEEARFIAEHSAETPPKNFRAAICLALRETVS